MRAGRLVAARQKGESRLLARSTKVVIDVQGGGKVTLALHEAMRILLLCEEERG